MKDITIYNERMSLSLYDKLFFLPRVNSKLFVDFGCADGYMLGFLAQQFPDTIFIGYDHSSKMIELAISKYSHLKNVTFTSDWQYCEEQAMKSSNATLILSSVIHEVYSYKRAVQVDQFWEAVFKTGFKYIVIRDMTISEKNAKQIIDLESLTQVRRNTNQKQYLKSFEARWGEISHGINWLHYLLKYRYHENWDREVEENYLPLTTEALLERIPDTYKVSYMSDYTLPYLSEVVRQDFDVDVKFSSHIKLILTLR